MKLTEQQMRKYSTPNSITSASAEKSPRKGWTSKCKSIRNAPVNGIDGDKYSAAPHLDAEELVTAGILDQATADKIAAYGSEKHDRIHSRYAGMSGSITDGERHALYAGFQDDGSDGDSVTDLFNAGIINQEQADAIHAYLG